MKMSINRVKENESFLRYLHSANLRQRKQLLKSASKEEIKTLCECAFNIIKKNVPLSEQHLSELRKPKNRKLVHQLADKSIPLERKHNLVVQSGGFPFALIAPVLASLIGGFLAR
jgi:hypothetical protein